MFDPKLDVPMEINAEYAYSDKDIHQKLKSKEFFLPFAKRVKKLGLKNDGKAIVKFAKCFGLSNYSLASVELKSKVPLEEFYKLNSYNFRSDEFTDVHDGKHILFAGCSVTFGDSLPIEHLWAYKLYNKIASKEKTSGFFNIGNPGSDAFQILLGIKEYIQKFGMPDVIFVNLPDLDRSFFDETKSRSASSTPVFTVSKLLEFAYEDFIEICKLTGTKIYLFSWDRQVQLESNGSKKFEHDFRVIVDRFYRFSQDDLDNHMYELSERFKDSPEYSIVFKALDNSHPGIGPNDFWFNYMYNIYSKEVYGD